MSLLNLASSQIYATQVKDAFATVGKQVHSQPALSPNLATLQPIEALHSAALLASHRVFFQHVSSV